MGSKLGFALHFSMQPSSRDRRVKVVDGDDATQISSIRYCWHGTARDASDARVGAKEGQAEDTPFRARK